MTGSPTNGTALDFDSQAADGKIAEFGKLDATVTVAGISIDGSAQDFAIGAGGALITEPGFGVSLNLNDSSKVKCPTGCRSRSRRSR